MLYLLAIPFPPIAVLIASGSFGKFLLNILATMCFVVPGWIDAFKTISNERKKAA